MNFWTFFFGNKESYSNWIAFSRLNQSHWISKISSSVTYIKCLILKCYQKKSKPISFYTWNPFITIQTNHGWQTSGLCTWWSNCLHVYLVLIMISLVLLFFVPFITSSTDHPKERKEPFQQYYNLILTFNSSIIIITYNKKEVYEVLLGDKMIRYVGLSNR